LSSSPSKTPPTPPSSHTSATSIRIRVTTNTHYVGHMEVAHCVWRGSHTFRLTLFCAQSNKIWN
jgi:hypothetical protein